MGTPMATSGLARDPARQRQGAWFDGGAPPRRSKFMEGQKGWPHPQPRLLFAKTVQATCGWVSTGMAWLAIMTGALLYWGLLTDCRRAPSGASLRIMKADSGQRRPRAG